MRSSLASTVPGLAAGLLVLAASPAARAHVQIAVPLQRHAEMKAGPCGLAGGERSDNVCEFQPGSVITVEWDETVEHPGHFRVSFDDDGVDGFADPTDYDDFYTAPSVLVDDIPDRDVDADGNRRYSLEVTLPDVECDNCTLQLIQVMSDKMPWGPEGGKDLYYQCADLVLSRTAPATPAPGCASERTGDSDAGPTGQPDAGTGDDGSDDGTDDGSDDGSGDGGAGDGSATDGSSSSGGCAAAGGMPAGLAGFVLVGLALITRRRAVRAADRSRARARSR
ncbi:MAG TPA: SCE4755 family polysaccharide monooxygenase-like protein [Kofleriaceae bacterium]|nr:SCE4755 family polysaccharide monooxygenase-like protein [Kofleriaceae bacterium]